MVKHPRTKSESFSDLEGNGALEESKIDHFKIRSLGHRSVPQTPLDKSPKSR